MIYYCKSIKRCLKGGEIIFKVFDISFPLFQREDSSEIKVKIENFSYLWRQVSSVFSNILLETDHGLLEINFEWDKHIELILEKNNHNAYYTIQNYFRGGFSEEQFTEINSQFPEIITLSCCVTFENENLSENIILQYIEQVIIQIFLTMNLSMPGSFNCYSLELATKSSLQIYKFSSSELDAACTDSLTNGWPNIELLNLKQVWDWVQKLKLGSRQIANSRIERALFSILHFCREDQVTPNQLIWVSLALETLYDTPKGQINKILLERISLFLEIPEQNRNTYKKRIRDFYELRSRFVHGDLDIDNPLANTVLDKNIWEYGRVLIDSYNFGISIVIATIQKMIKNQWQSLDFYEKFDGRIQSD